VKVETIDFQFDLIVLPPKIPSFSIAGSPPRVLPSAYSKLGRCFFPSPPSLPLENVSKRPTQGQKTALAHLLALGALPHPLSPSSSRASEKIIQSQSSPDALKVNTRTPQMRARKLSLRILGPEDSILLFCPFSFQVSLGSASEGLLRAGDHILASGRLAHRDVQKIFRRAGSTLQHSISRQEAVTRPRRENERHEQTIDGGE